MVDVEWGVKRLDQVYHSEDHLKMALAAELSRMYGEKRVRLEGMPNSGMKVDIGVRGEDVTIPIELKYETDSTTVEDNAFDETFTLSRQGAHDRTRYRFFEDVRQVEEIVSEQGRYGYIVLLTNDSNYWTKPPQSALYDGFRIHEGVTREGVLNWSEIKPGMVNYGYEAPAGTGWRVPYGVDGFRLSGRYQSLEERAIPLPRPSGRLRVGEKIKSGLRKPLGTVAASAVRKPNPGRRYT